MDKNHKFIIKKFNLNKDSIKKYINFIDYNDFFYKEKIREHLKNIYVLRKENNENKLFGFISKLNGNNNLYNENIEREQNFRKLRLKRANKFYKELIEDLENEIFEFTNYERMENEKKLKN